MAPLLNENLLGVCRYSVSAVHHSEARNGRMRICNWIVYMVIKLDVLMVAHQNPFDAACICKEYLIEEI